MQEDGSGFTRLTMAKYAEVLDRVAQDAEARNLKYQKLRLQRYIEHIELDLSHQSETSTLPAVAS